MNKKTLFILGKEIVNNVSKQVIKLSLKKPLGKIISFKSAGGDLTKTADKFAERAAIDVVLKFAGKHRDIHIVLISEESGILEFGNRKSKKGFFMILDPLDGSNNLRPWKTPSPFVVVSLAIGILSKLEKNDNFQTIDIGLVKDIFNNRFYYAIRNKGAFVEGFGKIKSSPESDIKKSIISLDLDLQHDEYIKMYSDLRKVLENRRYRRRSGSSILDFMKVACGEYDSFITLGKRMKLYDLAAAKLIAEEAGGIFELIDNKLNYCLVKKLIYEKNASLLKNTRFKVIASGNKLLHQELKSYIAMVV